MCCGIRLRLIYWSVARRLNVIQQLLGHKSIETTEVYLHCLPNLVTDTRSPLDDLKPTVVAFPGAMLEDRRVAR